MARTINDIGEFRLIERISRFMPTAPFVLEGIGDDCAVVRLGDRTLMVTVDMFMEDVHFRRSYARAEDIGWKAAACSLSDIAAMGGAPLFATVSLACPADTQVLFVEALYRGLAGLMGRYGATIIGGDTIRSNEGILLDVMLVGQCVGHRYLRRKGAMPGDLLAVTGFPGKSGAGLHALEHGQDAPSLEDCHLRPRPRVQEGQWLCGNAAVNAAIDISDGLAADAGHLAEAAKLGINIHRDALPLEEDLRAYCEAQALDPYVMMLTGGEDYELCMAVNPGQLERAFEDFHHEYRTPLTVIGEFTEQWKGVRVDGEEVSLRGFNHFG